MEEMKQHPLVIVFYLDEDMMRQPEIITPFAESVNSMLAHKEANALAFFIPTKGEERVECINPVIMSEPDMVRVNTMIEDIKRSFSVGVEMNIPEIEIRPDQNDCTCDGECNCEI